MFVAIPIGTDAPLYHWPYATVGLIVSNIAAFILTGMGAGPLADAWSLELGGPAQPLQWITANFVHFGVLHLLGNLIFLWAFGLVAEGKLGWWRFLLVYLGIGVAGMMLLQLVFASELDGLRHGGGASIAIYGLIAIALVWAPRSEVEVWYFLWLYYIVRVGVWEVSILLLAGAYLALQIVFAALAGFSLGSEAAHLIGAALGFAIALAFLKLGWVDCENWDLLSVIAGRQHSQPWRRYDSLGRVIDESPEPPNTRRRREPFDPYKEDVAPARAVPPALLRHRVREFLDAGKPRAALATLAEARHVVPDATLQQEELGQLIDGLCDKRAFADALPLLREYVERFPDDARLRLRLAAILVELEIKPRAALRVLAGIPPNGLPEKAETRRRQIERLAQRMVAEGHVEPAEPQPG